MLSCVSVAHWSLLLGDVPRMDVPQFVYPFTS